MTIPNIPFKGSQAHAEFSIGPPGKGTPLFAAAGLALPAKGSQLAGRSAFNATHQTIFQDVFGFGNEVRAATNQQAGSLLTPNTINGVVGLTDIVIYQNAITMAYIRFSTVHPSTQFWLSFEGFPSIGTGVTNPSWGGEVSLTFTGDLWSWLWARRGQQLKTNLHY